MGRRVYNASVAERPLQCCACFSGLRKDFDRSMLKPDDLQPTSIQSPVDQRPQITGPVVPERPRHDPYAAFRSRGYTLFTIGNVLSVIGRQMLAVAVELEIY